MSRLIFLNLPPSLTPDSFRSTLTSPPTLAGAQVTDTRLVPKRRFAFVGYAEEGDAKKVKDWFDGSFAFGGGKVKVDFVRDEPLAPNPKRTKTEPAPRPTSSDDASPTAGPSNPSKSSKQLQEFMDVMKGVDPSAPVTEAEALVPGDKGWVAEGAKGAKGKGKVEKKVEKKVDMEEDEGEEEAGEEDDDAAWLKRRQAALEGDEAQPVEDKVDLEEQLILSTGRLFVRNLAFVTTSSSLSTLFSRFGVVEDIHLPVSSTTGEPLGTAFVLFRDPVAAASAWRALDKTTFQGRLLHVLPGRARPGSEKKVEGVVDGKVLGKAVEGKGEVKGKVEERRKAESAKGVNWASMYMNSDAVAASVASRMGIAKSELLANDDTTSNPAVKLALAETHVIAETKTYFASQGIVLDSLAPRVPRSPTTILVKNIPFGTTARDLEDMFSPHGEMKRCLLPPSGTLGVVEFANPMDAGRAFKALAYRRVGSAVLYLEKGPVGMFKDPEVVDTPKANEARDKLKLVEYVANAAATATPSTTDPAGSGSGTGARSAPDEGDEAGSTLFLKNLSFSTTSDRLASLLSSLPGYSFSRIQTKPDPKRPEARLSMGYGFVGFRTREEAGKALKGLQGFEVDGKQLDVRFAQRGQEDGEKNGRQGATQAEEGMKGKTKSTKVLVKNLPFEATKKDVKELFSAYGTLRSVRVPRKATLSTTGAQSTRGFAFLEFTTHAEAERAMEALEHTHLLGRHLVMEWAREGEGVDVDKLREKVKRDTKGSGEGGGRKRKAEILAAGDELDVDE